MTIDAPLDCAPPPRFHLPPVNSLLTSPILPTLLKLAIPNAIAMFGTTLVAVAETSYIGRLGTEPLAGIALVFPFVMLTQMMSAGAMGGGVSSAISRAIGAGDRDRAATLALHAAMIGACAGIFFTVMMLAFGRAFYTLLGGRGGVLEQAMQYSHVLFSGAIAIWLVNTLASVVRGTGDMRIPSVTLIGTALVQIAVGGGLGLGLFGLPKFGMRGVAAGQLTAFTLGAVFLAWYLVSGRSRLTLNFAGFKFQRDMFFDILKVGAVSCLSPLQTVLTVLIFTKILAGYRHRDVGRLWHGLAAGIPADPDRVRFRRCLGADGRHGDGRGPCDARAAGGVDRGRRGRHHRGHHRPDRRGKAVAVGFDVHQRSRRHRRGVILFRLGRPGVRLFRDGRLPLFLVARGGEGRRARDGRHRTIADRRRRRLVAGLDGRAGLDIVRAGRRGDGRLRPRHGAVDPPDALGQMIGQVVNRT